MKIKNNNGLDFIIDKLTNSIENVFTGDQFQTEVSILNLNDLKVISKKKEWLFDWKIEIKDPLREVYKLTIVGNKKFITEFLEILLLLHVNCPFKEVFKVSFHSFPNLS